MPSDQHAIERAGKATSPFLAAQATEHWVCPNGHRYDSPLPVLQVWCGECKKSSVHGIALAMAPAA